MVQGQTQRVSAAALLLVFAKSFGGVYVKSQAGHRSCKSTGPLGATDGHNAKSRARHSAGRCLLG
jgi:hypothetical protein